MRITDTLRSNISPAKLLGFFVAAMGGVVIIGWFRDIPGLKSVLPGLVTMKTNTAIGFMLAGLSLALLAHASRSAPARWLSRACAATVMLLGLLTLCQYLFGLNLGIDQLLFREAAGAVGTLSPGRMAPATALNFLLVGCALLLAQHRRLLSVTEKLALFSGLMGFMPLIGYLYGATAMIGIGHYTQMAIHTALLFIILSMGLLLLYPADGVMRMLTDNSRGAWLLRRMVPFIIGMPLLIGWLRIYGERKGYFGSALGVALMVIILMLLLLGLVWWMAWMLNEHEINRQRADTVLQASELHYRRLFEASKDGILVVDEAGRVVSFNQRFVAMWGIPPDVVASRPDERALQFVLEKLTDPDAFLTKIRELYAATAATSQDEIILQDGRTFDRYSVPMLDADESYWGRIWFFRDITERKQVEYNLSQHYQLQAVLNTVLGYSLEDIALTEFFKRTLALVLSSPWLMLQSRGAIFLVDPAGKELQLQVYQRLSEHLLTSCATVPFGHCLCGKAAETKGIIFADQVDERHDTRYPGILPHGHYCVPILSGNHVLGVLNLYVSEGHVRNAQEEAFLTAIANTIAGVIVRKRADMERAELEMQLDQQHRLEAVGQLAAGVAHDFNNLLTGITGFTRFAHDVLPAEATARADLAEVLTLAERATNLTRQLLAFSRRQTLQPVILNINEHIGDMINMLRRLIGEHIDLRFCPDAGLGAVKADLGQLEQVLVNLVVNARDAMPDGGTLTIETANTELDADYASAHTGVVPGPYVLLAVTDTGCGMEAAIIEHIFEPFFTTKGIGKGTGLGLSTVYGIVKQHGGNVWVYSEVGDGTTFKVYLPRVAETIEAQVTMTPAVLPTGTETILIVEDVDTVRQVTTRILEGQGYHVLTAARPSQADAVLAAHGETIALLLTDVVMPERNGRKLYEAAHARYPHLRVLYMSGYTDNAIVHQGVLDTGTSFIQKPFTADTLTRKVREVLLGGDDVSR